MNSVLTIVRLSCFLAFLAEPVRAFWKAWSSQCANAVCEHETTLYLQQSWLNIPNISLPSPFMQFIQNKDQSNTQNSIKELGLISLQPLCQVPPACSTATKLSDPDWELGHASQVIGRDQPRSVRGRLRVQHHTSLCLELEEWKFQVWCFHVFISMFSRCLTSLNIWSLKPLRYHPMHQLQAVDPLNAPEAEAPWHMTSGTCTQLGNGRVDLSCLIEGWLVIILGIAGGMFLT